MGGERIRRRCGAGERREERKGGPGKEGKRRLGRKGERRELWMGERRGGSELWRLEANMLRTRGRKRQRRDGSRNGGHRGMKRRERGRRVIFLRRGEVGGESEGRCLDVLLICLFILFAHIFLWIIL